MKEMIECTDVIAGDGWSNEVDLPEAPPASAFPAFPASWYLFCASRQLRKRPVSKTMFGRQLVGFRTRNGTVSVLEARCAHLGADLAGGEVVGECIRCPFHHWEYDADGQCVRIPGMKDIPRFARQRCYPAEERHGQIFVFNGAKPLFPLPFCFGERSEDFVGGEPFRYVADCTWYMNASHGFDTPHFQTVHDRKLLAPPVIDCPAPYARRTRYRAEVVGETIYDRLLRPFAGRIVDTSLTIWGGNFLVVTARFERVESRFLMTMLPLPGEKTLCEGIVFVRRSRNPMVRRLLHPLALWVRRVFTHGYLRDELRRLRGTRYQPQNLIATDREKIEFFRWAASLPQSDSSGEERW
jgi:nitrite reductase/ring-hydroxylating ferredoxin subunit